MAGVVAVTLVDSPPLTKTVVLTILALTHLLADALPHHHFCHVCSFEGFKRATLWIKLGTITELGGGLIILPLIIGLAFHLPWLWLLACVISANFFDFLMTMGIAPFVRVNLLAHWWLEKTSIRVRIILEVCQTAALVVTLMVVAILKS